MTTWLPRWIACLMLVLPFVPAVAGREDGIPPRNDKPQEQESRKLLGDARPAVRLRAALALAKEQDVEAIPVLIDLLAELPPAECQQIEEALRELAGEWAPVVHLAGDDDVSRRIRRGAWAGWWNCTDGPALLAEFRKRTLSAADQDKVQALIRKLGDKSFRVREQATADLVAYGTVVVPLLRAALKGADLERQRRVERCLQTIASSARRSLPPVAARLLALRKPPGAVEALLAFLPWAEEEHLAGEVQTALTTLAVRDGKVDPALVRALDDPLPVRRAVAAEVLARAGGAEARPAVRKLLHDADPTVRIRVASALAEANDKEAISVLRDALKDIERLVQQLGSDDFRKREDAIEALNKVGDPSLAALRAAATSSDDAQLRQRAAQLHRAIAARLQVLCYEGHTARVTGVAFSPDGRRLISASDDGTVRLIEASTGKLIHCLAHPSAYSVAFSPDGKKAISTGAGENQTLRLWDIETGKELKRFAGYQSHVCGAAFSPDGKQVLYGAYPDKTLRLLDVESGKDSRRFEGHTAGVDTIALSADGKKSLSGSYDTTVRLWDNATGKELKRFDGHKDRVYAVALSKDGKRAVSGGAEHVIKLWDLETGREIRQLEAHAFGVHGLAFSSDGRRIASANYDGYTVSLWDAETGKELHRFEGHTDCVYDVAFSPDGRFLVSGGADKSVRVWRVPR